MNVQYFYFFYPYFMTLIIALGMSTLIILFFITSSLNKSNKENKPKFKTLILLIVIMFILSYFSGFLNIIRNWHYFNILKKEGNIYTAYNNYMFWNRKKFTLNDVEEVYLGRKSVWSRLYYTYQKYYCITIVFKDGTKIDSPGFYPVDELHPEKSSKMAYEKVKITGLFKGKENYNTKAKLKNYIVKRPDYKKTILYTELVTIGTYILIMLIMLVMKLIFNSAIKNNNEVNATTFNKNFDNMAGNKNLFNSGFEKLSKDFDDSSFDKIKEEIKNRGNFYEEIKENLTINGKQYNIFIKKGKEVEIFINGTKINNINEIKNDFIRQKILKYTGK